MPGPLFPAVAIAVIALAIAGCVERRPGVARSSPDLVHIHALDVDTDGSLIVGTHVGLFRLAPGASQPRRIGHGRRDTRNLAVGASGRARVSLEPALHSCAAHGSGCAARTQLVASSRMMLFASANAGRSWRAASLKHSGLLAWPRENELYVADSRGQVHRSPDAGQSWRYVGRVGGAPVALAAHDGELFVALRDDSIRMSLDGGRTWTVRVNG